MCDEMANSSLHPGSLVHWQLQQSGCFKSHLNASLIHNYKRTTNLPILSETVDPFYNSETSRQEKQTKK